MEKPASNHYDYSTSNLENETQTRPDRIKMKPGPEVKTQTIIFLKPGPDQIGPEKLKPGPEEKTRTEKNETQTQTGADRNILG